MASWIKYGYCKNINVLPHFYLGELKAKQFKLKTKTKKLREDSDSDSDYSEIDTGPNFESKELMHLNNPPTLEYLKPTSRIVY